MGGDFGEEFFDLGGEGRVLGLQLGILSLQLRVLRRQLSGFGTRGVEVLLALLRQERLCGEEGLELGDGGAGADDGWVGEEWRSICGRRGGAGYARAQGGGSHGRASARRRPWFVV